MWVAPSNEVCCEGEKNPKLFSDEGQLPCQVCLFSSGAQLPLHKTYCKRRCRKLGKRLSGRLVRSNRNRVYLCLGFCVVLFPYVIQIPTSTNDASFVDSDMPMDLEHHDVFSWHAQELLTRVSGTFASLSSSCWPTTLPVIALFM